MDRQHSVTEYLNPSWLLLLLISHYLPLLNPPNEIYDENQIIVMFGGLHLNNALWKTKGDFLDQSGGAVTPCC